MRELKVSLGIDTRNLLIQMGYKYSNYRPTRDFVKERSDVVAKRHEYLTKMRRIKTSVQHISIPLQHFGMESDLPRRNVPLPDAEVIRWLEKHIQHPRFEQRLPIRISEYCGQEMRSDLATTNVRDMQLLVVKGKLKCLQFYLHFF